MDKPWEIKKSDKRTADTIPTYIIFCEDKVSEPVYLKYFETSKIKINFAKEQKSMMANVLSAITQCKADGLMGFKDGKDFLTAEGTQVWCVFDRDKEETSAKILKGEIQTLTNQLIQQFQVELKLPGVMMLLNYGYYYILKM